MERVDFMKKGVKSRGKWFEYINYFVKGAFLTLKPLAYNHIKLFKKDFTSLSLIILITLICNFIRYLNAYVPLELSKLSKLEL